MNEELKRISWFSKETLVPYGAACAFAALSWYGATQFGSLQLTIQETANRAARDTSDQAHALELQILALKNTVEVQGRDLAQVKESVDQLTRGAKK